MENPKRDRIFAPPKPMLVDRAHKLLLTTVLALGLVSCNTTLQPRQLSYADYAITPARPRDSSLLNLLKPYRDSVDKSMNMLVANAAETLEKRQPSGSLGNFMADAVLEMARTRFGRQVDFAIINYGGIRSPQLAKGPVTRGKIFELMPFDNLLVLQELSAAQVQQLLDFIAAHGGWPVAGVSFTIRNKKATDILMGGQPLDPNKKYVLANSDYVANGGDNASFLTNIPQVNMGYLIREALLGYAAALHQQGKQIEANNEMRINHVQ